MDTEKKITKEGLEHSSARLVLIGTTIITARGTVGRIALVGVPMAMNQSCYGLRGKAGAQGFFNYFATCELVTLLQRRAHGSVFDTITRDTLAGAAVAVPPTEIIDAYELLAGPALHRIRNCILESDTLADLRDALLPRLISGNVKIKNPDRFAEKS